MSLTWLGRAFIYGASFVLVVGLIDQILAVRAHRRSRAIWFATLAVLAIAGAVGVMTLLEGSRFLAAAIPAFNAVQVASIREFCIAAALIVVMQIRPEGAFASRNQMAVHR